MNGRSAAKPARFDASKQHFRSLQAKVHIAKQQLGLSDDDYAAVLLRVVGRTSSKDCSQAELDQVVREFERLGFSSAARPKGPRPADHPMARKARAMWLSLGLLGAIEDVSEKALEAFARRQLGCARLQWANQAQGSWLVEALGAIAERHGWSQSVKDLPRNAVAINLKRRLCRAILDKLKALDWVPADWTVQDAAFKLAGIEIDLLFASPETVDLAARALGAKLAEARR